MVTSREETKRPQKQRRISSVSKKFKKVNSLQNPLRGMIRSESSSSIVHPRSLPPPQASEIKEIKEICGRTVLGKNDNIRNKVDPTAEKDETHERSPSLPVSPRRAHRIAMLKNRFAETILQAEAKLSASPNIHLADPIQRRNMQEKEAEAKRRMEAAKKMAAESRLRQIKREREAAWIKLNKMQKTVEVDNYFGLLGAIRELGLSLDDPFTRRYFA